jgi:MinD superfamily P-loop ATPase
VDAIAMIEQKVGKLYVSDTKAGNLMVHARLGSGADNSGKLVAKVKKEARQIALETAKEFVIVDGSPGIGCPVVSSLSGADYVVLVTEPSVSGIHDLKRVYGLVQRFHIAAGCIINKADINPEIVQQIEDYLRENGIMPLFNIPFNDSFTAAMTLGQCIVEYDHAMLADLLTAGWNKISQLLSKEKQ